MELALVLQVLQVIFSLLVIFLVIIQGKAKGFSSVVSSSFNMYRSRRGAEKFIFGFTIFCGVALALNSVLILLF